jgi:hypothetical protein
MDFSGNTPQGAHTEQSGTGNSPRHVDPVGRRPVISDFGPRPHAAAHPTKHPEHPQVSAPSSPAPQPQRPASPAHAVSSIDEIMPTIDLSDTEAPITKPPVEPPEPEERPATAHSGIVGLVAFLVLAALALSPFLPGKIFQSFPGSSQTTGTGEQSIGCAGTLSPIQTTTTYNTKLGFPIVYNYATTSKIRATCDGTPQTATGGHASQFSPLGALANVFAAAIVAFVVARIWRTLFSPKP